MPKPCLNKCGKPREQWSSTAFLCRFCGPACAAEHARAKSLEKRAKAARKDLRARKEALKTRGDYLKEAQAAFNSYIRERDYGKPCISCGTLGSGKAHITGSAWDCGHYRSTGAAPHLRFHTLNAARQCTRCNRELSGNAVEMRKGMVLRFGMATVEAVESDNHPRQYDIAALRRIKRIFRKRARLYRKLREGRCMFLRRQA